MFCTNCGKEIPDTSQFCKYCGNKIRKGEESDQIKSNQVEQEKAVEKTAESTNNTEKKVKVTFHRLKKFTGCAVPMYIYIDKKLIATLKNNATFETYLTYGKHKIIIEMWSATSEKEVDFQEDYKNMYIDVTLKMGLITNRGEIVSIRGEK